MYVGGGACASKLPQFTATHALSLRVYVCAQPTACTALALLLDLDVVERALRVFLFSLQDYTVTSRGDVGSAVRLQAIDALGQLLPDLLDKSQHIQSNIRFVRSRVRMYTILTF